MGRISDSDPLTALNLGMAEVGRPPTLFAVPYHAEKTGQVRPGLKIHELKTDNRAVCGNSRREPMDDLGPGTVTCESCALDTGHHMVSSSPMRYFRVTKRNEQTGETRVDTIGATHVPGLATYEVNQGWSIVSPIEELDGPPPLSDDAVEELKGVFADHLKRKHGVAFDVTMEQKQRQPRVIAKHDVPS
jgi:hypothetical protein